MDIATAPASIDNAAEQSAPLRLTGSLVHPMSLSLEALRQYPAVTCPAFDLRCYTTQRFIRTVPPYRGARLTDLLEAAQLRNDVHGDFKRMVFLAVGHDGYFVTFSWHELFNTPVGQQVIVAYECGDTTLDAQQGAPVLFSGADLVPAPRHVKRLARIEARVLAL
ncbi:molybdopterin-dependent oxidoreductase [Paraburkholderia acidiphila]|uniref:Molybdopterin-dependent oxidoreductase n=1 Tax=Paraburkholderia acidiphila TaxID=2571747 RepID=A0A7Z2GBF2_9BURK|nr:molybdopterin-dependent oxidoreductase [Paraburkholderia acidiphila]QGZ58738.1 molybdopterin-dependent oxidoreductase [Paraburkholderia acidiphila]